MHALDLHCLAGGVRPVPGMFDVTACAIMSGLQDHRLTDCPWHLYCHDRNLLVAGSDDDPPYPRELATQLLTRSGFIPTRLLVSGHHDHTLSQAEWVADVLAERPHVRQVILVSAAYHLPRCVLTFIKTWAKRGGAPVRIGALPTMDHANPLGSFGNKYGKSGSVSSEVARIETYQKSGDVATPEEFAEFVARMPEL